MRTRIFALLLCGFGLSVAHAQSTAEDYRERKSEAESLFDQGSYAKANEIYRSIDATNLPSAERQWVAFRLSDTQWRSAAATQTADTTRLDEARTELQHMIRDVQRDEEKDRVWAEVQESLGDFWWTRRNQQNWGQAWPHYEQALDWWAGQSDLDLARKRYLSIVWRCARPPGPVRYYRYGYYGNYLPLQVLQNALKIAQSDEDKAHAHYLIATTLQRQGGRWEQQARVPEEFEAALALGQKTDWYDDALFNYAQWMTQRGRIIPLEGGSYRSEPDYVKALELFRRLVQEFDKGETRYWDQAQQQIRNISNAQVSVTVANIFLPDSEIQYQLNWRNVKRVDLALYPVDLTSDVDLNVSENARPLDWLNSIELVGRETVRTWEFETDDKGDYKPGGKSLRLQQKLKPGAYVLEAKAGGQEARDLVLVTDAAVVLKASGKQALVYVCDALGGAPIAESQVTLWARWREDSNWQKRKAEKQADQDGIAVFDLTSSARSLELFVAARSNERQAFSTGSSWRHSSEHGAWKIYAFTDRPAYRPSETVHWKFTARRYNGSVYSTPANATIHYEISDPRGAKVKEDQVSLNQFGSAWGSLDLTDQMPLGEYRITFWDEGRKNRLGGATLFRLEEYKLPEFKVTVSTPEESSPGVPPGPRRKKAFRLGDTVEATIQADYYFGGPVANADVEVIVYQNPFWMAWPQPREFPWFYEDMDAGRQPWRRGWGGNGQIVKRETLKTDAKGQATVNFDTPANDNQDYEYRIEARVTDASRREIIGTGTVRVTGQLYYVHARPEHNLYQPQDKVTVEFHAQDANENPVSVEGMVKVTRQYWWEIWLKPDGTEVKGDQLKQLRAQSKIWPPPPERPDQKAWKLKFRGYEQDDVLTQSVKTDTNGVGELSFTPAREGYYRVEWTSEDKVAQASGLPGVQAGRLRYVKAETTVWVADNRSTDIGYRHGGVEIIADKDTFRVGNEAPVMLVANSPDRYVLFSVEGEELQSYRLVHLTGTIKLINLLIEEQHVPNIYLGATMVSDRQIFTDTKQVVVPPTRNFLTVEVQSDRERYQPRDEGALTVTTKDDEGNPVSAEVALSLVDESVFYIQSDYAGDPRQFFYGDKRPHQVQTRSTMNQKSYAKLVEVENAGLRDEKEVEAAKLQSDEAGALYYASDKMLNRRGGGMGGGGGGGALGGAFSTLDAATGMPVPAAAMPAMVEEAAAEGRTAQLGYKVKLSESIADESESAVVVRSDFRSTILWQPDAKTDTDGTATVKVKYPDSVTSWKASARAATTENQFGIGEATTRTKQPLIVRLQAPRFFVVGDEVVLSAVVNNNTDQTMDVKVSLDVEGGLKVARASGLAGAGVTPELRLAVPANGEARADWRATVVEPGDVKLKATARGSEYADAMEKTYRIFEHGIEKFISKSGKVRSDDFAVKLDLPKERKANSTTLTVQVTPSMAVTMLDALPYLIDYPYGCTEQTMSRFLPAVITAKTLGDLGLQPEDVMGRVFGGIETNTAVATHPKGKRDLAELDAITKAGLERLYDFQHSDGGWGWWKEDRSDYWMTAYVVWGMSLAHSAGVELAGGSRIEHPVVVGIDPVTGLPVAALPPGGRRVESPAVAHIDPVTGLPVAPSPPGNVGGTNPATGLLDRRSVGPASPALRRAVVFLDEHLVEEEDQPDMQAWMLHALAVQKAAYNESGLSQFQKQAFDNLWKKRDQLNAYTRALFALAAHRFGMPHEAKTLVENLENGVIRDERPDTSVLVRAGNTQQPTSNTQHPVMGTAHWGNDGVFWRWSDGGVEATAFALRALLEIDPHNKLIEPVSNWLIKNRRGAQWSNTRDTAIVVLAMNDYLRASGELTADIAYDLYVNGERVAQNEVSGEDIFSAPSRFAVPTRLIQETNEIHFVRKRGDTPIYFAVEAKFFSLEEPVPAAGNEIFVKRQYYKLVGRPTLLKGYVYDKEPLLDGASVKSGERVETVITVEAKNNYEYLVFEDLKPAGFEAVQIRSGESLYAKELKSSAVERMHVGQASSLSTTLEAGNDSQVKAHANVTPQPSSQTGKMPVLHSAIRNPQSAMDYTGRTRWVHQELRDRKVALFIDKIPEGVWELRYDFRAEVPGEFHALPVVGHAMYVPEIRCNGEELRVNVEDAK